MPAKAIYDTERVKNYTEKEGIKAMDLVRLCGIAVSSAYDLKKGLPVNDLDVLYRVYEGLKSAGHDVTWTQLTGIQ